MSNLQKYLSMVIIVIVILFIFCLVLIVNIFSLDMGRSIESANNFYSRNPNFNDIYDFVLDYANSIFWIVSIALLIQTFFIIRLKRPLLDEYGKYLVYVKKKQEILEFATFRTTKELKIRTKRYIEQYPDCEIDFFDLRMGPLKLKMTRDEFNAKVRELIDTW